MKFIISVILFFAYTFSFAQNLEKWTVTRIVDGDTIYAIDSLDREVKFRLIGIDAPESRHPFKPVQPFSKEATNALIKYLNDPIIYLEFDIEKFDRYGRTLAYLYDSNRDLINAKLIADGFAQISTYPPNVKYVELFKQLQSEARKNKKGMWSVHLQE